MRRKMASKRERLDSRFTLIELLVVITIMMILFSMLFPALKKAREMGIRTTCISKIKQAGLQIGAYVDDYNGRYPPSSGYWPRAWPKMLAGLYKYGDVPGSNGKVKVSHWCCPSYTGYASDSADSEYISYGMNLYSFWTYTDGGGGTYANSYLHSSKIKSPSAHLLLTETLLKTNPNMGDYRAAPSLSDADWCRVGGMHAGQANVFFCDGHVTPSSAVELNSGTYSTHAVKEPWNFYNQ